MIGGSLGHYQIVAKLGEGGMGQVWQATDTQLNRQVALKILPDVFADDPDRLARFQREAQVLASLNHPNIAAIYGIETSADTQALVLELVEGPTLADRIALGPIPVDEALPIARQMADALEAAHEQGIIHRDLKPANIKVKADGTVKVLDFGLAKAFQPEASDPNLSLSPTISLTAAATQMGMVIGTAAYMAPEQARGRVVDKRADIFAFGVVLYEMLTGQRPFQGEDVSLTLAAVMTFDPDLDRLPETLTPTLKTYLTRCLAKDPKQRVHDIADVRLALEGAFDTAADASTGAVAAPRGRTWRQVTQAVAIGLAIAVLSGLGVWFVLRVDAPPANPVVRFAMPLADGQAFTGTGRPIVAISPRGDYIAFTANNGLWLRRLNEAAATLVPGSIPARNPFFSDDGQWLAFYQEPGQLKRVAVTGGASVTVGPADNPWGASWGADDTILYGQRDGIWRVPGTGGTPVHIVSLEEGAAAHGPQLLPGGEWVLFTLRPNGVALWNQAQIVAQSLSTNERRILLHGGRDARYLATGHLVYGLNGALMAVPFDSDTMTVTPGPVSLVEGLAEADSTGAAQFSVSRSGSLVYARAEAAGGGQRSVVWVDSEGREEPLTGLPADDYQSIDLSPDGTRLALEIGEGANSNIWTYTLADRTLNPVTTDPALDQVPLWMPDGRRLVFASLRLGDWGLYRQNADGTGDAELLFSDFSEGLADVASDAWTPQADTLVFVTRRMGANALWVLSMEDRVATELPLETEFNETRAALSPEGDWIAYESNRSGQQEIYVERFPDLGDRRIISTGGGQQPIWSPDGEELFYLDLPARRLMVVQVTTERGFDFTTPEVRFEGRFLDLRSAPGYDVAPDGQGFVMIKLGADSAGSGAPQLDVVLNWVEELKERVPVP